MVANAGGRRNSPATRQGDIAAYVLEVGEATATSLAERFGISLMTVHRDLDELERRGVVRKHRGGVTAQPSSVFESHLSYRLGQSSLAKAAIAREARKLIEPGMAIMLDDSTSALTLAKLLGDITPLIVITNFLEVIRLATTWHGTRVIALGGEYNPNHDSFLGVSCVEALSTLRVDLLFASTSTVSGGFVYHQEQEIVLVKRAMLNAAASKVLLADHTKLGRLALHRVAPLDSFDVVITDSGASEEALREMRETTAEVIVAGPDISADGAETFVPAPNKKSRARNAHAS